MCICYVRMGAPINLGDEVICIMIEVIKNHTVWYKC